MAIALKLGTDGFLYQIGDSEALQADAFERKQASGDLLVGSTLGASDELRLGSSSALVRAMGDARIDGYIELSDTTAPGNPSDGEGRLYKKTGNDGLFWLPDSGGSEVDLTDINGTLQDAYENGNTIAVTSAEGVVGISNDTDATNAIEISRTPSSAQGGNALTISMGANASGVGLDIDNYGSGSTLTVKVGGTPVLVIGASGAATIFTPSGEDINLFAFGALVAAGYEGFALGGYDDSTISVTGGDLDITTSSSGDLTLAPSGDLIISNVSNFDAYAIYNFDIDAGPYGAINIGCQNIPWDGCPINIGTLKERTITIGCADTTEIELNAALININPGGNGFNIQKSATNVFEVDSYGSIGLTPPDNASVNIVTGGTGYLICEIADYLELGCDNNIIIMAGDTLSLSSTADDISLDAETGELIFDDVGNSGITLSQSGDRTLDNTSTGELLNGVTSIVGAINALSEHWYPNSSSDPSGASDGDAYFNTSLNMEMRYDSTRSKWLSVAQKTFCVGRNGTTDAGVYYRGVDGLILSNTRGFKAPYAGTVVGISYTRDDSDSATFEVTAGGTGIAELASSATSGYDNTLNGNFSQGDVLAVRNKSGGNQTEYVSCCFVVKWRA